MIKPIDTQVLYPQTPEVAGRQHKSNQLPSEQQTQFGNLMKKEVEAKKDTIVAPYKADNLKTNKDKEKERSEQEPKGSKKKQTSKKDHTEKIKKNLNQKIDIRI